MPVAGHYWVVHGLEGDLHRCLLVFAPNSGSKLLFYHVDEMIRNLSRLVISRVRQSKDRTQLPNLALKVNQNLLVAFVGFDLAHRAHLQLSRHFIQVSLLVALQCVFKLGSQTTLSTFPLPVADGEFGFLALEYKR